MKAALIVLICAAAGLGQQIQPTEGSQERHAREKDKALGERYAGEILRQVDVVNDPVIAGYVENLAQRLSGPCAARLPIIPRVIVSDDMNAFALPGGFLFVNTGLIRNSGSEAELAGLLAHLLGRLSTRDETALAQRGQIASYAGIPLIYLGAWTGYSYAPPSVSALTPLAFLDAYRAAVLEADAAAIQCLAEAGYDPETYVQNLEKIQDAKSAGPQRPSRFSSHPPPEERIERVRDVTARIPWIPEFVVDTSEFKEVKERLERLYPPRRRPAAPPSLQASRDL